MSSRKSVAPLYLRPAPSRLLLLFLVLIHLLALSVLPFLAVSAGFLVPVALLVLAGLYRELQLHVFRRHPRSVVRAVWESSGRWRLTDALGVERAGELLAESYVHPQLVLLNFKLDGAGRRSLVLLPDSEDRQTLRELRVRLRTRASGRDQPEPPADE